MITRICTVLALLQSGLPVAFQCMYTCYMYATPFALLVWQDYVHPDCMTYFLCAIVPVYIYVCILWYDHFLPSWANVR